MQLPNDTLKCWTPRRGGYAYPAINVTSSQTLNAALQGFLPMPSRMASSRFQWAAPRIFPVRGVNDRVTGSLAFAAFAHEVAKRYPHITVALHTDHCAKQYLDGWVRPLLDMEADEVAHGREPMFQSHMWDGSTVPLDENLAIAEQLLDKSVAARTILEIEIGAVGGEEDGHSAEINEKTVFHAGRWREGRPASRPGRARPVHGRVHVRQRSRQLQARRGQVAPGTVGRHPAQAAQAVVDGRIASAAGAVDFPNGKPFALVFHGGSGSRPEEIAEAVRYGVVKMNIDTDTQYAFTRAIADHVFSNYDAVLKVDGEVGEKKLYDPRSWGREAESAMAARVVEACKQLGSAGKALK